jgi:hypothetical protein
MIQVKAPDGSIVQFPDGTADDTIKGVMQKNFSNASSDTPAKPFSLSDMAANSRAGFMRGVRDPIDAGAEMLTHGLSDLTDVPQAAKGSLNPLSFMRLHDFFAGQAQNVDATDKAAEAAYDKTNPGLAGKGGRVLGNLITTLPLAGELPATLPRAVLTGAKQGAVMGALEPNEGNGDFWTNKATQAVSGATSGGLTGGAVTGLSRVVSPMVNPYVRRLLDAGVTPTPGQIIGGKAEQLEEAAQNLVLPGVSGSITKARNRAVDDFNRAATNEALSPIGEKLSDSTPVGREAVQEAADKVSAAYNRVVPQAGFVADPTFNNNVMSLINGAQSMVPARAQQFNNILRDKVFSKFSPVGGMTGQSYKEADSELGRLASDFRNSADADQRQLGSALLQMQAELRGALSRSNPAVAGELQKANDAYANLLRTQGAAASAGAEDGVFSPAAFASSVRRLDPSLRKVGFAKGTARMQDLADAAKNVLSNRVPNSGSAYRAAVQAGVYGPLFGGLSFINPTAALTLGAAGGLATAAYSRPGTQLLARLLAERPQGAEKLAQTIRLLQLPRAIAAANTQPQ